MVALTAPLRLVATGLVVALVAALCALALAPASSASNHQRCSGDARGDVFTAENEPATAAGAAAADVLEVCATYAGDALTFSLRVAEPTDPAADPAWSQGTTAVVWGIQAQARAYGSPTGQVALSRRAGNLRAVATWLDDQTPACEGTASFDGSAYEATFDPACLEVPDTIAFNGAVSYDTDPGTDLRPGSVLTDVAPEGMGREGEGRFAGPLTRAGAAPADGALAGRLGGATRIDTAVQISRSQFPRGAEEVYLAGEDAFADAVVAGVLDRGPVLLVPRCGELPPSVAREIQRLQPVRILALGGPDAVCDALLDGARRLQPAR